jgi:hypothetical protein
MAAWTPVGRSIAAGAVYFAMVFSLGFVLGAARVIITAPALGEAPAVLLELPVVIVASWFASGFCVARIAVPPKTADRLIMGLLALGLTLAAELGVSVLLFERTAASHFATYSHFAGLAGLAAQGVFALIPLIQGRRADIR